MKKLFIFKIYIFLTIFFCSSLSFAFNEDIYSKYPTSIKKKYCLALTKHFNDVSQSLNSRYYGIGVKKPNPKKWELMGINKPGFFDNELRIWYFQITKEKIEDFKHVTHCIWEKNIFSFYIEEFQFGSVIICYGVFTKPPRKVILIGDCPTKILGF